MHQTPGLTQEQIKAAWEKAAEDQMLDFIALSPTQKFRLLMEMIETLRLLEPARRHLQLAEEGTSAP